MPFFPSLSEDDNVPRALANFNIGVERPLIEMQQRLMRDEDSPFSVAQRELIAAFVSATNACQYCTGSHTAVAVEFGVEEDLVTSLQSDIDSAKVDENFKPILKFVKKLTLEPTKMVQSDADKVFSAGWSERALYEAILVCCTFNFMNRFVEGLGLGVFPEQFSMAGKMLSQGYDKMFEKFDFK